MKLQLLIAPLNAINIQLYMLPLFILHGNMSSYYSTNFLRFNILYGTQLLPERKYFTTGAEFEFVSSFSI